MVTKKQQKELAIISQKIKDLSTIDYNDVIHYEADLLVLEALKLLGGEVVIEALNELLENEDVKFWY